MDSKQNRYLYDKKTVLKNEKTSGLPEPLGLYNPRNEHDACGIGFVADIKNPLFFRKIAKLLAKFC